ncbi:Protein CBG13948 [Caenorhabditis briggsae]|uniref:Uncharacterized protein n=2 Tax=Caenorhabditis briggsae TaxID=6238 RepID=A0AAE9AEV9_CAEBR|nr:Protein CBG13948 [Caenorhabditis briggsae]ULT97761.1 hypothetical protein L3Y34_005532 [Caenorhabditis briggsae]CAP32615.1 Protein CBG13948 [Caenorhabditis briggsae]
MGLSGSKRKEEPTASMKNSAEQQTVGRVKRAARPDEMIAKYAEVLKTRGILPEYFLVHEAKSSQYIDEDGDVANEFYQETMSDGEKRRLCRLMKNLRPKGKERYAIPRLKPDIPVVIWEVSAPEKS